MRLPILFLAGAGCALALGALARADEPPAADVPPAAAAEAGGARVAQIPAHCREVREQTQVAPVTEARQVPVYEDVTVPVYEVRCVPEVRTVEVPVYESREVPVYGTQRVPRWGEREVAVCAEVCEPVTVCVWNPFTCENEEIHLWDRTRQVQVGTRTEPAIVGYDEQTVQVGTRTERVPAGTETRQVLAGYRNERVQVGERTERRVVGWRSEEVVVAPARVQEVVRTEQVPCEAVTVVPDGVTGAAPIPGTRRVMTESEYHAALAAAR